MRDLVALCAMLVFIPLSLRSTFVAYILWGWAGLIALNGYLYGFMLMVPYVQIFALISLGTWLSIKDPERQKFENNRTTMLFVVLVVHGFFCALFAYPGLTKNWEIFSIIVKTVLFCVLMPMLVTNRFRLHAMVVMIALAITFHGGLEGLKFIASGGAHNVRGLAQFGDNNHFAMVMIFVIPLLYYLLQYSANRLVRWGFSVGILLVILTVIGTRSRGGLLGLVAVGLWLLLKSRRKLLATAVIMFSSLIIVPMLPSSWSYRMQTIESAGQDESFMGRVTAWKVSSAIAVENPILGGGFRAVQSHPVWDQFKNSPGLLGFVETPQTRSGVAAHSIWFEVMGDMGLVGFLIFIILIANAFVTNSEIRKLVKRVGEPWRWASDLADLLGAIMFVYVVAGSALSAAYFEIPYIVMMMLEVIKQQLRRALTAPATLMVQGSHA
jgi:probable O-glycosylation ligase (exosortase A-associated)